MFMAACRTRLTYSSLDTFDERWSTCPGWIYLSHSALTPTRPIARISHQSSAYFQITSAQQLASSFPEFTHHLHHEKTLGCHFICRFRDVIFACIALNWTCFVMQSKKQKSMCFYAGLTNPKIDVSPIPSNQPILVFIDNRLIYSRGCLDNKYFWFCFK